MLPVVDLVEETLLGGIDGLFVSFWGDFPSGAAIVCSFGVLLIIASLISLVRPKKIAPSAI